VPMAYLVVEKVQNRFTRKKNIEIEE